MNSFMPTQHASLALLFAAALTCPVWVEAEDKAEAKAHFETGKELYQAEDYAGAQAEFERSVQLSPTRTGLFNLANCYKALHRYAEALSTLERLEREFAAELRQDEELAARALEIRDGIRGLIATLEVKTEPAGAEVLVDGESMGHTPLSIPLLLGPGEHRIEAHKDGYVSAESTVVLVSKSLHAVTLELALAKGMLTVSANLEGVAVSVDGTPLGTTPLAQPISVSPGVHEVSGSAVGHAMARRVLTVEAGQTVPVELVLEPLPFLNQDLASAAQRRKKAKVVTFSGVAGTVVFGAAIAVLFPLRQGAIDDFYAADADYLAAKERGQDAELFDTRRDEASSEAVLFHGLGLGAIALTGVFATAAIVGAVVWAKTPKAETEGTAVQWSPAGLSVRF